MKNKLKQAKFLNLSFFRFTPYLLLFFGLLLSFQAKSQVNDTCAGAIEIFDNIEIYGNTSLTATNIDQPAIGTVCGTASFDFGFDIDPNEYDGVWYKYEATTTLTRFSTCSDTTSFETQIAVYTGNCDSLSCFDGADFFTSLVLCSGNLGTVLDSAETTIGETYYIYITGQEDDFFGGFIPSGNFGLTVSPIIRTLANDTCAGAIEVFNDIEVIGNTTDTLATKDDEPTLCGGITGTGDDAAGLWFTYTATAEATDFSLCSDTTDFDTQILLYSGDCDSLVCITGNDDNCESSSALLDQTTIIGETYYVYVRGVEDEEGFFGLTISETPLPPPVNDTCSGAIEVFNDSTISGSTLTATAIDQPDSCSSTPTDEVTEGVWYVYEGILGTTTFGICDVDFAGLIQVYSGDCSNLVCLSGDKIDGPCGTNGGASVELETINGTDYYVYISGFLTKGDPTGDFNLTVSTVPPPVNDTCAGAIEVFVDSIINGTTDFSTNIDEPIVCGEIDDTTQSNGVWYFYDGLDGLTTFSLCSQLFDAQIQIFSGSCGMGNLVCEAGAIADESCSIFARIAEEERCAGCDQGKDITIRTDSNTNYYVYISGYDGDFFSDNSGDFSLALSIEPAPPINDTCLGAKVVEYDIPMSDSTLFATNIDFPEGCDTLDNSTSSGVWFEVIGKTGQTVFETCDSDFNSQLSVYTGSCDSLVCLGGNDDSDSCSTDGAYLILPTIEGETYYVYVTGAFAPLRESARIGLTGSFILNVFLLPGACDSVPNAPIVTDSFTVCAGESVDLVALSNPNDTTNLVVWYDEMVLDPVSLGANYTTPALFADASYFASVVDSNGCEGPRSQIFITVNDIPANPTAENDTVCQNAMATLEAVGNGGLLTWYSDGAGVNEIATSATYTTPVLTQTTSYYVSETNTTTGCRSDIIGVQAVVTPLPDKPQAANTTLCIDEAGTLTATGSGTGSLIWYDANQVQIETDVMPPATGSLDIGPFATAGTYFFYVSETDGICESALEEIEVVVGDAVTAPVAVNDTVCIGESSTITVNGSGGQINWYADITLNDLISNGPTLVTDPLFTDTTFYVTESFGSCESLPTAVAVEVAAAPEAPVASSNGPICEGATLMLMASLVPNATYSWTGPNGFTSTMQNPTVANVAEGLQEGTYTVAAISTTTGCASASASVEVEIVITPVSPSISSNSPVCEADDLELTAEIIAGAEYTWYDNNNVAIITTDTNTLTIPNVAAADAGAYGVSIGLEGCMSSIATTVVTIKDKPNPPAVVSNGPVCENSDLVLTAEIISGATYTWIDPNGDLIPQNGPIATVESADSLDEGTYGVLVTIDGCTSDTATVDVVITDATVLPQNPTTNAPVCEFNSILLQAPYNEDFTYSWSGPNGYTADSTYIDTVNNFYVETIFSANENDDQGFYTLTVTDNVTGCTSIEYPVLVIVNNFPDNIIADNDGPICAGEDFQLDITTIVNATYTWTGPGNYISFEQSPIRENATFDMSGTYEVVIDLEGCTNSVSETTEVIVYPNPVANAGEDIFIEEGNIFQLDGTGSSGAIDFAWVTGDQSFFDNPTSPTPFIGINGLLSITDDPYIFTLAVYNELGCSDIDTVNVFLTPTLDLIIPNIITPNGDGANDVWVVQYIDNLEDYELSIYARGGTLVLKTTDYTNDWGGTSADGDDLPEGTYWYTIRSSNAPIFKGYIEIIK